MTTQSQDAFLLHFRYNWLAQQLHRISSFQLNSELYVVICHVLIPTTLAHSCPFQFPLHHQVHMVLYAVSRTLCWRFKYQLLDPQHSVRQLQHVSRSWNHWWLTERLTDYWVSQTDWLTDWSWLTVCAFLSVCLPDWLTDWLTASLTTD